MRTRAHATYKCNMCNKPLQHVEQLRAIETWLWNKHHNDSNFYVSRHVRPIFLCNLDMVYMFSLYNTLPTLRTLNGTRFMLTMLTNCVSKWWLTMGDPRTFLVWPNQKYSLGCLHGWVTLTKFVPNFMRNKSCFGGISWKCLELALTWPTRQLGVLISALSLFG
jgi:hypothetical protein